MNTTRAVSTSIAAVTTAVFIAACGATDQEGAPGQHHATSPSASQQPPGGSGQQDGQGQHNDQDVVFAQGMIPHHEQAVEMSRLAPEQARSEQVKNLARQIEQAQGPEIEMLTGWLHGWGAEASHGSEHGAMKGMMTQEDMERLTQAQGADFDRAFLRMMIAHHEGAVEMAQTELAQGEFPAAKKMAEQIIDSQQAEIDTMRNLLNQG